jgi:hypothetical protein
VPSTSTLQRILLAGGFKLEVTLLADETSKERRTAEILESLLDLADAFPRSPAGPLLAPIFSQELVR